jgi:hypothetical protein
MVMVSIPISVPRAKLECVEGFKPTWPNKDSYEADSSKPIDCRQVSLSFEKDQIDFGRLNGRAKVLGEFIPLLKDKKLCEVLEELAQASGRLPALKEEFSTKQAEAFIVETALAELTDPTQTEAVFAEVKKLKAAAELAKAKVDVMGRAITSLRTRLVSGIRAKEAERFKELMKSAQPEIALFNESVKAAYERLSKLFPAFEEMAVLKPGQFPPSGVYAVSPHFNVPTGIGVRTARLFPQIKAQGEFFQIIFEGVKK